MFRLNSVLGASDMRRIELRLQFNCVILPIRPSPRKERAAEVKEANDSGGPHSDRHVKVHLRRSTGIVIWIASFPTFTSMSTLFSR